MKSIDLLMEFKEFALEMAEEAEKILIKYYDKEKKVLFSDENDIKIEQDVLVEEKLKEMIKNSEIEASMLSEETYGIKSESDLTWIIDPLDGTVNYYHGIPHFCTSIALEKKGEIIFGLVNDPMRREIFIAEKGKGAFLNGRQISVSKREMKDAIITLGLPWEEEKRRDKLKMMEKIVFSAKSLRMFGSCALGLSYVSAGRFDGSFVLKINSWDFAAGALLVEEAGGKVTDITGKKWSPYNDNFIATNSLIHENILKIIGDGR